MSVHVSDHISVNCESSPLEMVVVCQSIFTLSYQVFFYLSFSILLRTEFQCYAHLAK